MRLLSAGSKSLLNNIKQKPQGPVRLIANHPLVQGLFECVMFTEGAGNTKELVTGRPVRMIGSTSWTNSVQGSAGKPAGGSTTYANSHFESAYHGSPFAAGGDFTLRMVHYYLPPGGAALVVNSAGDNSLFAQITGAGTSCAIGGDYSGGDITNFFPRVANTINDVVIVRKMSVGNFDSYYNGVFDKSYGVNGYNHTTYTSGISLSYGGGHPSINSGNNSPIIAIQIWSRALSLREIQGLYADPYQFVAPQETLITIFSPPTIRDLAGDLAVTPAFAGETADFFALTGDLAPSTTFAGETADLFVLAGDLPVTPTFAADTTNSLLTGLAGNLPVTPAFAAETADLFALAGDLSATPGFAAGLAGFANLAGDLAPSVAFAGSITSTAINISFGSLGPAINAKLWGVNYSWNLVPQATFPAWATMYNTTIGCLSYTHPSGWNGENYHWDTNTMDAWANWTPGGAVGEAVVPFVAAVASNPVTSVLPAEDYVLGSTNPATGLPWTLADMVARIQAIFTGGYAAGVGSVILGNEFWNYAGAHVVATRQTILASYCTLAANIIPWIRTNYPSVKIYVTGEWLSQTNWVTGAAQPWGITTDFAQLQSQISALSAAAWAAIDGVAIHNYAGTDTTLELWSQVAPTVASIQSITGKTVVSTEWAATKDRTDQDSAHNYKFGVKNTQVMLLIADQMAMSGVQAASFWPDCYTSVNIAMADTTFTVVQYNGLLMNWLAKYIYGTYLNVNDGGFPSIAAANSPSQVTIIFAAAQDGRLDVSLAMGSYTTVVAATVMYHPTPNTNTTDYTAQSTTLPVTVAGGNANFSLNIGGAGRGPGWEIAILTLSAPAFADLAGNLAPSVSFVGDIAVTTAPVFVLLSGNLAPSVVLAGDTTGIFYLQSAGSPFGDGAYGLGMYSRVPGAFSVAPVFSADILVRSIGWRPAPPCPPSTWTPADPCAPVVWEEVEPCSG